MLSAKGALKSSNWNPFQGAPPTSSTSLLVKAIWTEPTSSPAQRGPACRVNWKVFGRKVAFDIQVPVLSKSFVRVNCFHLSQGTFFQPSFFQLARKCFSVVHLRSGIISLAGTNLLFLGNSWMMILDSWIPFLIPAVHSVLDTFMFTGLPISPLPASC